MVDPDYASSIHSPASSSRAGTRPRLGSIEIYPRPDGTIYAVAGPDSEPLSTCAGSVRVDKSWIRSVRVAAGTLASSWASADVFAEHACYLPSTPDGMPVIGWVPGLRGLALASGHSCWGILLSPATGRAVATLLSKPDSESESSKGENGHAGSCAQSTPELGSGPTHRPEPCDFDLSAFCPGRFIGMG